METSKCGGGGVLCDKQVCSSSWKGNSVGQWLGPHSSMGQNAGQLRRVSNKDVGGKSSHAQIYQGGLQKGQD